MDPLHPAFLNKPFQHQLWPLLLCCGVLLQAAHANVVSDDFTKSTNTSQWIPLGYACLTAGTPQNNHGATNIGGVAMPANSAIPGCNLDTPDQPGSGALRLTSKYVIAAESTGAIVSDYTFPTDRGLQITFTSYTWGGNGNGPAHAGGDGMSFFLMDGSVPTSLKVDGALVQNIGSNGGPLGYSCHNLGGNPNGLTGAYLGLGMDEYGNFLNGGIDNQVIVNDTTATGVDSNPWANSFYLGPRLQGNRIGLRGAGNVSWYWLSTQHPELYPPALNLDNRAAAVAITCKTGHLWDYSSVASGGTATQTAQTVADYAVVPGGTVVLPNDKLLATPDPNFPSNMSRSDAVPITYKLLITPTGYLSLNYSYNHQSYQPVITNYNISTGNAPLPDSFRFGFSAGTGAATNNHEITCFVAEPALSSSGASANTVQAGQVRTGTQVYAASYSPTFWNGSVVARPIVSDANGLSLGDAIWDGNCQLSGGTCLTTGVTIPSAESVTQPSLGRVLMTWSGNSKAGIPLQWNYLTANQKLVLGGNDAQSQDANGIPRLHWLRGNREKEQTAPTPGPYRSRVGVLGDVVDSSPTWVGPPSGTYGSTIADALYGTTGSESPYAAYKGSKAQRTHVLYAGANDGYLHAFRAGANDSDGNYVASLNDGLELFAYMPATVLSDSRVRNLMEPTYGHEYFVDATPGTGDLYVGGQWRTWLASGMGPGGKEVFVLDITNPDLFLPGSKDSSIESTGASSVVRYDWTDTSLNTCSGYGGHCGDNLGYSYGTPLIRRLHNGKWAIIFGNGLASQNGVAGAFIAVLESNGPPSMYWLSTNAGDANTPNGIAYVATADIDGDHVTDYLYGGDQRGNVWRFDLTSTNPSQWGVSKYGQQSATPLFKTSTGQPITTQIATTVITLPNQAPRLILGFGTGQKFPFDGTTAPTYASGTQSMYGIWDWDMGAWNEGSGSGANAIPASSTKLAFLSAAAMADLHITTLGSANLLANALATSAAGTRSLVRSSVCWQGSSACPEGNNQFGWKFDLPSSNEQIIYNPAFQAGTLFVNTTIPPVAANAFACTQPLPTGWTMGFDMASGGGTAQNVFANSAGSFTVGAGSASINGVMLNAVGRPYIVAVGSQQYIVNQTVSGDSRLAHINPQGGVTVKRLTWEQVR